MSALPLKADIGSQLRNVRFVPKADIVHLVGSVREPGAVGVGIAVDAGKRHVGHPGPKPVQLYRCSPGKCPDTRTVATASDEDSRGSVHDSCLCIAV